MSITVLDTYSAMRRILLAPAADRVDLLRSMLEPTRGMFRYSPGEVDLVAMHLEASGFPIDRDEERCLDALETLAAAGAWERMQRALDDALTVLLEATPGLESPDITVLFVLGDPGDEHFMGPGLGMTGFGGAMSLYRYVPSRDNLIGLVADRLMGEIDVAGLPSGD